MPIPVVAVSGHGDVPGVTNIVLNHEPRGEGWLSRHLAKLGIRTNRVHQRTGVQLGYGNSLGLRAADGGRACRLAVNTRLVGQLEGESSSPQLGYEVTRKLLATGCPFTALFAFNDISAIGAIHPFAKRVAACQKMFPWSALTTFKARFSESGADQRVRQPLQRMGVIAAETLLRRDQRFRKSPYPKTITIEPEFIVRASTASVKPRGS